MSNAKIITLDDLNCGDCLAILEKKGHEKDANKAKCMEKTPDKLLNMTTEELEKLPMDQEAIGVLKDIKEGLYTYKIVNDPVHGHIEIHPLCVKIIDTPQFQRLRYLKQLGAKYFVYPGASHNRFEHSLGVCYLAGEFVSMLQKRQKNLEISDKDILCVQIAGLCHDLGHGPFSHMFHDMFLPLALSGNMAQNGQEDLSVRMFKHLVDENDLKPVFKKYGIEQDEDWEFINDLINPPLSSGRRLYQEKNKEKGFLYEIVSNKRNGIDVDKWDYFARDCQMLGIKTNFDHNRCMKYARVLTVNDESQICFRDKECWNVYEMFHTKNILHRTAYQHRVGNIIEAMITEAMLKADKVIKIPGKNGNKKSSNNGDKTESKNGDKTESKNGDMSHRISKTVEHMDAYQNLTDDVFHQILLSREPSLENAREILRNIQKRKLYKSLGQIRLPHIAKVDENTFYEIEGIKDNFKKEDFIIHSVIMDYGMDDKNPGYVYFYNKSDPGTPVSVKESEVSNLFSDTFAKQLIEVFCKKTDEKSIQQATCAFVDWKEKVSKNADGNRKRDIPPSSTPMNYPLSSIIIYLPDGRPLSPEQ